MITCGTILTRPNITVEFTDRSGNLVPLFDFEYAFFMPQYNDTGAFEIRIFRDEDDDVDYERVSVCMDWPELGFSDIIYEGIVTKIVSNLDQQRTIIRGEQIYRLLKDIVIPLDPTTAQLMSVDPVEMINFYMRSAIDGCDSGCIQYTDATFRLGEVWSGTKSYAKLWDSIVNTLEANSLIMRFSTDDSTGCTTFRLERLSDNVSGYLDESLENAKLEKVVQNIDVPNRCFVIARDENGVESRVIVDLRNQSTTRCIDVVLNSSSTDTSVDALTTEGLEHLLTNFPMNEIVFKSQWNCHTIPFVNMKLGELYIVDPVEIPVRVKGLGFNLEASSIGIQISEVVGVFEELN